MAEKNAKTGSRPCPKSMKSPEQQKLQESPVVEDGAEDSDTDYSPPSPGSSSKKALRKSGSPESKKPTPTPTPRRTGKRKSRKKKFLFNIRKRSKAPLQKTLKVEEESSTSEEDSDSESDQEEYEVDYILNSRTEYLVKWKGYPEREATWEPTAHLNCNEAIREFHKREHAVQKESSKPGPLSVKIARAGK